MTNSRGRHYRAVEGFTLSERMAYSSALMEVNLSRLVQALEKAIILSDEAREIARTTRALANFWRDRNRD